MAIETTNHAAQTERESRHSALEELYRDERRPALLLLSGLVIAVLFFALGIMVGRWMATNNNSKPSAAPATPRPQAPASSSSQVTQPTTPSASNTVAPGSAATREEAKRFALLIATFNTVEEAQPLIKKLEEAGYKDVRTSTPRTSASQPKFSILVGHYARDEANQLATRMRSTGDPRLRYVRVIEE